MADQNPMRRDGGRRDKGEQPYRDAKEKYAEKEAKIERSAPLPDDRGEELTDEEKQELAEQTAEERFDDIGKEMSDNKDKDAKE